VADVLDPWQWPPPPLAWRHVPPPPIGTPQACSVEGYRGSTMHGQMLGFDTAQRDLVLRTAEDSPMGRLAFSRFRRLTLHEPLRQAPRPEGAPRETVPAAAQERGYTLHAPSDSREPPLTGRTAGHVQTADGMFLYTPIEDDTAVLRVFVPGSAFSSAEFGDSAEEVAARLWIGTPAELLDAIERQHQKPMQPLGHSLLVLGLLTPAKLDAVLARPKGALALGETLVSEGVISHTDLQTALAHKMGHPLVDLTRFPIDPAAMALLPRRMAESHGAMPLMLDQGRLIVAIDTPARVVELHALQVYAERPVVPVLAPRSQILTALLRLSDDVWKQHVADRDKAFAHSK
jgi:Type II secretion system (T2SS), protein E, N-terminal domain